MSNGFIPPPSRIPSGLLSLRQKKVGGFIKLIFVLIIGSIIVGGGAYLLEIEDRKSVSGIGERIDQDLISLRKKLAERRMAAESKLKNIVQEEQNKFEKNLGIDRLKTADIDTSAWKTYRNEKYGFEVRYPPKYQSFPLFVTVLDNPKNLDLQGLFNQEYSVCLKSEEENPFGCPSPEKTAPWKKVVIDGKDAIRSGPRLMPEGPLTDSLYIVLPGFFLLVEGKQEVGIFDQILSTFKFTK